MKNKKLLAILIFAFVIFVVALPTVCVFIPYKDPILIDERFNVLYNDDFGRLEIWGEVKNPTVCKINKLIFDVSLFDIYGDEIYSENVEVEIELKAGDTQAFSQDLNYIVNLNNDALYSFSVYNFEYEYNTLYAWVWYVFGFGTFGLFALLFKKIRISFQVEGHKVDIYATETRAVLVVDGKVFKELKLASRSSIEKRSFRIKERILKIELKYGYMYPDINVWVDGKEPSFAKITQHSFLKIPKKQQNATTANTATNK